MWRFNQKLWWLYFVHMIRRHSVCWFACGTWITSVECISCDKRWEDES